MISLDFFFIKPSYFSYFHFVCVRMVGEGEYLCVCPWSSISKNIEPINFIVDGRLLSDSGGKPFDFREKKNRPGRRVDVGVQNLSLMIRDGRKFFEWL